MSGPYMAARRQDRAAVAEYRLIVWQHGENRRTMRYREPVDALAAAIDFLKAGYQVRLADEIVEHFRGDPGRVHPSWFPALRDWKLLDAMLRRAIEMPGFFSPAAESAGRDETRRLAGQLGELIAQIGVR